MDVGGWLRRLGLEQYEAAFRENEIDDKVLPRLTAEDLKDLGVGIVGHRRKLLDAIAALRADASAKALPPDAVAATDLTAKDTAERRQVTVMFSDLVGSTALSARMDPEDLREVISAYQKCLAETVQRFGGFVAKYMGDGVLVYFGYPEAHEDDAERAVPAGLELMAEVVGREEELELLLRRWSKAKNGEGQVVLLSGEAGIGKSRLIAALLKSLATEPHTRLRYFCSPQHTASTLYPVIGQMERAAGFTYKDTPQAKVDKLDALLAQSLTSAHDTALLAEMLSLPNDSRYPALELTPQQRRRGTLEALVLQVTALSHENPVLMIFEDAQWTDPTSLELFGRIVDKIPTLRVLLIVAV